MGLVRNLRKKFSNWVDITLAELCSAYIKQLAKQTSKRQDNCSSMEYLPNNLTMVHQDTIIAISSQDTSEKITMELTEDVVAYARAWSIDRLDNGDLSYGDQKALLSEFEEWIDIEEGDEDLEIISLEPLKDED